MDTLPSGGNSGVRRDGICILPFISGVRSDASGGDAAAVFKRRELCRRRKEELRLQFKEAIQIVASALAAGYSVENAFIASVRDLEEQYGKEGMITREFSYLASQLKMNQHRGGAAFFLCEEERSG